MELLLENSEFKTHANSLMLLGLPFFSILFYSTIYLIRKFRKQFRRYFDPSHYLLLILAASMHDKFSSSYTRNCFRSLIHVVASICPILQVFTINHKAYFAGAVLWKYVVMLTFLRVSTVTDRFLMKLQLRKKPK